MKRRTFLGRLLQTTALLLAGAGGLLKPLLAYAERNMDAFSETVEVDAIAAFFPDMEIMESDAITIGVHDLVENGAVVPIKIKSTLPNIESIAIFVEKNPNPLIANFNLSPVCEGLVETRIKMGESSYVSALVKSDDRLFRTRKFVEIIEGGC